MRRLAAVFALIPVAALAHDGPPGHLHPHGIEVMILGALALALVAGAVVVWRRTRR